MDEEELKKKLTPDPSSTAKLATGQSSMPETDEEWKKKLSPAQYEILRKKGTEAPFSGKLLHESRDGVYRCAACENPLFASDAKFDSGTGWPSFDQALPGAVEYKADDAFGMPARPDSAGRSGGRRTEVLCAQCGSHLGHVFDDGPTATGKRYCLNSVCLDLAPTDEKKA